MYILIGGDIVPTESNIKEFSSHGEMCKILGEDLINLLKNASIRIFNLETPISDSNSPIEKEGPCFIAPSSCIIGLNEISPTLLTLANNHILDQGFLGLKSTREILKKNNIAYTGVGENIEDAKKPSFFNFNGKIIGVLGCVETEYTVATNSSAGAYAFDALETPDWIREIKKQCDYLIVLYHGGKEYYRYPSPELQRRCRKMADCGADVILCQHSHCIGCVEKYKSSEILYGQGSFILDSYSKLNKEYFETNLLVKIEVDNGMSVSYIPVVKKGNGVKLADDKKTIEIMCDFNNRSEQIKQEGFIAEKYIEYASKHSARWICRMSKFGYLISAADNRFFGGKILNKNRKSWLGKHQRLAIENCMQCESYNELLKAYLKSR